MVTENEIWVDIPRFEGAYQVSSLGRVRSLDRMVNCGRKGEYLRKGRVLKTRPHPFGYPMVTMSFRNKRADRTVHSLVAEAFIGPRPEGLHTCHDDGDVENCREWNLYYGTPTQNNRDKVRHGTQLSGEDIHCARLTSAMVAEIREKRAQGQTLSEIGNQYELTDTRVWKITTGRIWKNAPGPITSKTKCPRALTPEEVEEARTLRATGMTISKLAAHFGVSRNQCWTATK